MLVVLRTIDVCVTQYETSIISVMIQITQERLYLQNLFSARANRFTQVPGNNDGRCVSAILLIYVPTCFSVVACCICPMPESDFLACD